MSATSALQDAKRLFGLLHKVLAPKVTIEGAEAGVLEGLYFKLAAHAASAIRLAESPTVFPDGKAAFTDVASVYALARSAYESAIVLHHVFLVPTSTVAPEARRLRLLRYRLKGFLEHRDLAPHRPEHQELLKAYAEEAHRLRDAIKKVGVFQTLPLKRQQAILDGENWREEAWWEMAREMGIAEGHFRPIYSFLCAQAHSAAMSAGQLWNSRPQDGDESVRRNLALRAPVHLNVPLAKTILAYAARFPEAKALLEERPEDVQFVETLALFADVDLTKPSEATKP